jgi:predicted membrane protein
MSEPRVRVTGRLVVGVIVIALGVLFTLDNLDLVDSRNVLRWWPAALVAYGVMRLTGFCCRRHLAAGLLFTVIGGWLLLEHFDLVSRSLWDLWPVMLVLVGGSMVAGSLRRARGLTPGEPPTDVLSAFALWSGSDRRVVTEDFRGGDVTAIMGGHDIDLRPARISGGSAVIDLLVVMGGVDLIVPEDWRVSVEGLALMGAIEDHTRPPVGEPRGTVVLKGLVFMGGVEVKN